MAQYDLAPQSANLISGYNMVAAAYTNNPKYAAVAAAQGIYRAGLLASQTAAGFNTQMSGSVDAVLDAVLGDSGTERNAFDTEFAAYQLGNYYKQKLAQNYQYTDARTAFINALNGVSLSTLKTLGNADAIIAELHNNLLTKINNAMNVDSITNTTNKSRVQELNGYLLTQIGADIQEFSAFGDDAAAVGFNTDISGWPLSQSTQQTKAHELAANFDTQFLKQPLEQTATTHRVSELLANFNPAFIKERNGERVSAGVAGTGGMGTEYRPHVPEAGLIYSFPSRGLLSL